MIFDVLYITSSHLINIFFAGGQIGAKSQTSLCSFCIASTLIHFFYFWLKHATIFPFFTLSVFSLSSISTGNFQQLGIYRSSIRSLSFIRY